MSHHKMSDHRAPDHKMSDHKMSLSQRLREAAIERASRYGDVIDSCVLGPDGVVDLRVLDDSLIEAPGTRPAAALITTAGGVEVASEIQQLFATPSRLASLRERHRIHR